VFHASILNQITLFVYSVFKMKVGMYQSDIPQIYLCHADTTVLKARGKSDIRKSGEGNGIYTPTKFGEADAA
jgi:hypothetical protein